MVEYINANYKQPLTLTRISNEFYLSTFYLSRIFKQVTGFSFVEYLQAVRIKEARRLLRETRWKIIEVAEESGFDNVAHFGACSSSWRGNPPCSTASGTRADFAPRAFFRYNSNKEKTVHSPFNKAIAYGGELVEMDIHEAIRTRRSIGKVKPDPVEPVLIHRILEAGTWAPNHYLTQPWKFFL